MDLLTDSLVFLHFLGLASLIGGMLVQVREFPRLVNNAMLHGIATQLVTGIALVGVAEAGDEDVHHLQVGVKLAVAVVLAVLIVANRRKPALPTGLFFGLLGLSVLNVAVAVFWR